MSVSMDAVQLAKYQPNKNQSQHLKLPQVNLTM